MHLKTITMKKHRLFYFMLLFATYLGMAQVSNGNITLTTQAEVDAFNFTKINGKLIIKEASPGAITNIDNLSILTSVFDITIENNTALTNINGLSNITGLSSDFVELNLVIKDNSSLVNLDGLSNLKAEGQDLRVINNSQLQNIDGLSGITTNEESIGTSIIIKDNQLLQNINGLSGITVVSQNLWIEGNQILENLDGLANILYYAFTEVDNLILQDNINLQDACGIVVALKSYIEVAVPTGLEPLIENNGSKASSVEDVFKNCCETLDGNLIITSQSQIDNFNFCEITGNLTIKEAVAGDITDLKNLSILETLGGSLTIEGNSNLTQIVGFEQVPSILEINIKNNPELLSVRGFNSLTALNGFLLSQNPKVERIEGLSKIDILKDFKIFNANISELPNLNSLENIRGDLNLNRTKITNIDALQNLKNIGNIFLSINPLLDNINGLSGATINSIVIRISSNNALRNINGIAGFNPNPNTSPADVVVSNNASLENLDGLSNLALIRGRLILINNPNLQNACGVLPLLTTPGAVKGEISISNNSSNTSSANDIIADCSSKSLQNLTDISSDVATKIYPIPSNGQEFFIKNGQKNTPYQVISFSGIVIAEGIIESVNQQVILPRSLQKGIYFVKTIKGDKTNSNKLVVN